MKKFPKLNNFFFDCADFKREDLRKFLMLNPLLERKSLQCPNNLTSSILQDIENYVQNIEEVYFYPGGLKNADNANIATFNAVC